jgi:RNA polymerase sigma-70 factor (ECF subfamily)
VETIVTSDPDGALLQQYVRTHDPVAFDQIARRYRAMVFSVARRVTQSHHDAEDVAQSCFLELAKKAASIRSSIPAFLHATATRRSIDVLRDRQRRQKHETKAVIDRPEPVVQPAPIERSWDEISPEVDRAIEQLPEESRTIVILYFLRGLSVADIVVETGSNRGMIERRLQVGVRRLRAELARGNRIVTAGALAVGLRASSAHAVPASLTAATGRMALAAELHQHRPPLAARRWPAMPGLSFAWLALAGVGAVAVVSGYFWFANAGHSDRLSSAPYDRMSRLYAGYLPSDDVDGFALHTTAMRTDASAFWRGSQPLFFQWCKSNCQDWLANPDDLVRCHASPNLEDAQHSSILVNTDNCSLLPIQIELLQGMIISQLAADRNLESSSHDSDSARVAAALCEAYKDALIGDQSAAPAALDASNMPASAEYVDRSGRLKSLVLDSQDKVQAFLRPSPIDAADVSALVGEAISRNTALRSITGDHPQVSDVRACVRHDAVVTQGQLLLIVQLAGTGTLLEMKQQIPAPAELAGAAALDSRPPAQRAAEDAALLSPSRIAPVGWCEHGTQSFTIVPLDLRPQVYELRKDRWLDPMQAARCWAVATAATHRNDPHCSELARVITPQLESDLVQRSHAYLRSMQAELQAFNADPRVARDRAKEDALADSWLGQTR